MTPPPSGARAARPQVPPIATAGAHLAIGTAHPVATRVQPQGHDEHRGIGTDVFLCVHHTSVVNFPRLPLLLLRLSAFFAVVPFPALALTNSSALVVPAPAPVNTNAPALTDDIRKLKPPVEIADPWFYVWLALAILAAAALAWFAWRWWQRRQAAASFIPPIPPPERARIRLQQALDLLDQPKPFCIAVSDALRQYLEERFNFRAPERTTEEFVAELRATALLNPEQKKILGEFLAHCDMVKFARHEPGRPELMDLHRAALRLIQETETILPIEPPPVIPPPSSAPTVQSVPSTSPPPLTTPPALPPPLPPPITPPPTQSAPPPIAPPVQP